MVTLVEILEKTRVLNLILDLVLVLVYTDVVVTEVRLVDTEVMVVDWIDVNVVD